MSPIHWARVFRKAETEMQKQAKVCDLRKDEAGRLVREALGHLCGALSNECQRVGFELGPFAQPVTPPAPGDKGAEG